MAEASGRPRVLAVRHTPGKGVSRPRVALAAVSANSPRLVARAQHEQGSVDGAFDKLVSGLASALEELAAGAKGAGAYWKPPQAASPCRAFVTGRATDISWPRPPGAETSDWAVPTSSALGAALLDGQQKRKSSVLEDDSVSCAIHSVAACEPACRPPGQY